MVDAVLNQDALLQFGHLTVEEYLQKQLNQQIERVQSTMERYIVKFQEDAQAQRKALKSLVQRSRTGGGPDPSAQ